ncbi:MBL fold metallo-hydrolase [Dehalococcoidia bacterium]|nr:MBL fold metallo-hydrolase [Dehalococcoidia bacterium]
MTREAIQAALVLSEETEMVPISKDKDIQIERLELGPFGTNAYVLICQRTGDSVLVDAPARANNILKALKDTGPKCILITHTHMDHLGALPEVKSMLDIPVAVHHSEAEGLPIAPDVLLNDGDTIAFGNMELKVLHTPGHTPGSICLLIGRHLISGDTIFPGGPGKTGSPGDFKVIIQSIASKILVLPDDTRIYPGHGDSIILGKAKEEFAVFSSRQHDPGLCGDVLWLSS